LLRLTGCTVELDRGIVRTDSGLERGLSALETALLHYLAERPGQDVGRDELLREVWGGGADRAVDNAVRRLRAKLGEPVPPRHLLTAHGVGYRFVPLLEVQVRPEPVREAVIPLATGDLHLSRRQFVREGQTFALSRIEALLLEQLAASLGEPVPRARLIERIWGKGRHEHTLDATLSRLRHKLERDPGAPVALLTARGQGPRLVGARQEVGSSFVDRPERQRALEALAEPGLVTLLGTAGIGKTRLAREVGTTWLQSGRPISFCDLSRVTSEAGLVARLCAALDGQEGALPQGLLAARPEGALVVLDNLEQLVHCAALIGRWVEGARHVRFLATSRVPLGLPCERCVALEPLEGPSAVRLFRERAPVPVDEASVAVLVERLDRLPLAIELAAALTDRMEAEAVLERLGARLDLLVLRPEGAMSQHSTLRGAIDWSWHLLEPEQQQVLAATSVFCAPFDADAACVVVGRSAEDTLRELAARSLLREVDGRFTLFESIRDFARERLILSGALAPTLERHAEHFVALAEPLAEDLGGCWGPEALVRLREMREELLSALEATQIPAMRGRLAQILTARGFLDENPSLLHEVVGQALARGVSPEHEGRLWILAASSSWQQGEHARAEEELLRAEGAGADVVQLAMSRARLALTRTDPELALAWLDTVQQARSLRQRAEGATLRLAARALQSQVGALEEALREALPLAEEVGDAAQLGLVYRNAARLHRLRGDPDESLRSCERALEVAQRAGRPKDELMARFTRASMHYHRGAFASMEAELARCEALARRVGQPAEEALLLRCWVAFERLEMDAVLQMLPERSPEGVPDLWNRSTRALVLQWLGRPEEALALLGAVIAPDGYTHLLLAGLQAQAGRPAEARDHLVRGRARLDVHAWGVSRKLLLTEALVELEGARGTEGWEAARARGVLAQGERVRCEDGQWRERPGEAAFSRVLLERALRG
jgi:DNA-binding response OmpR family regulator/predicted ATPase